MADNTVKIIIQADGKQAVSEIKGLSGEFTNLGGKASSAGSLLSSALKFGGTAVVFSELKQIGEALVETGMKATRLQNAFKAITGSTRGAANELEFVRSTANSLGLEFMGLADAYKGISAAARGTELEGKATRDIFLAVSQASATLGLSAEETKGSLYAISQMISKGKISSEELRQQLGERLPGAFQIWAQAMGVSTAKLDEMLAAGEVGIDTIPKFAEVLSGQNKNSAAAAAETFQGRLNQLKNELTTLATSIWNSSVEASLSAIVSGFSSATRAVNLYREATANIGEAPMGLGAFYEPGGEDSRSYEGYSALSRSMASRRSRETAAVVKEQEKGLEKYNAAKKIANDLDNAGTKALKKYTEQWQALETVRKDIGEENYWRKVGAAAADYTKTLEKHTGAAGGASAAESRWNSVMDEGENIRKSVRSGFQIYQDELERLKYYLDANAISQDTYARAVEKAGEKIGMVSEKKREIQNLITVAKSYEAAYGKRVLETTGWSDAGIKSVGALNEGASDRWSDHRKELDDTGKAYKDLQRTIEGWGQKSAEAIVDFVTGSKGSFSDLVDSILKDALKMATYKGVTEPAFNALGKGMGGLWDMVGGWFSLAHEGWVAGTVPTAAKFVDPAIFATARRYHSGLNADEFPAILQRGEVVVPRGAASRSAASAAPAVNIQIKNESGTSIELESQRMQRSDSDGYILGVVLKASRTNDSFRRSLAGALPKR